MSTRCRKICILNPVEVFVDSPRTQRFVKALRAMDGITICTIGIGEGADERHQHLDLADGAEQKSLAKSVIRKARLVFFVLGSLTRNHWLSEQLHSPNRRMRCNWLLRRKIRDFLEVQNPDLVIARDVYSVPLLPSILNKSRIWIDLPDLTTEVSSYKLPYRLVLGSYFRHLAKGLPSAANSFSTVSQSLAEQFRERFLLEPIVIQNALPYHPQLSENLLGTSKLEDETQHSNVRLVYVGAAIRRREIELCIGTMRYLPANYSLDLFLIPTDPHYLQDLRTSTRGNSQVRILSPIPQPDIVDRISKYSAALIVIPTSSINSVCSLPNKFFQAVQARLPIVTGPTPEIANLVTKYQIGVVSASFRDQDIADACRQVLARDSVKMKHQLENAAHDLSDSNEIEKIRQRTMSIFRKI